MKGMKKNVKAKFNNSNMALMIGDVNAIFLNNLNIDVRVEANILNPACIACTAMDIMDEITFNITEANEAAIDAADFPPPSSLSPPPKNEEMIPDIEERIDDRKLNAEDMLAAIPLITEIMAFIGSSNMFPNPDMMAAPACPTEDMNAPTD
jgi:hypothetical protein